MVIESFRSQMGPEIITSQMSEFDLSDDLAKSEMSHDDIQQCLAALLMVVEQSKCCEAL